MTKSKKLSIKTRTKKTRKNNKCVYTDEVYYFKKEIKEIKDLKSKMKSKKKGKNENMNQK
jgi:hypothetical protein